MAKILKTTISKENWHTSKAERRAYLIGEIGRCCEGGIVTSFMTLFLVFQGIDLKLVAGVMLAVKIIDALDDVIFGYFIDRLHVEKLTLLRKITGEGKYLPWFRLTFALFPLFTILFFLMPTSLSMTGKLIWFTVFYILYDFGYTLVEVPMNSMMVTLTDNLDERNHIIKYKTAVGGLAVILVQVLWMVLVSEYVGIPLRLVALVSSVVFFFMMLPLATKVREYNTELANVDEKEKEHYSLRDMLNCVKTNKYLMILLLSTLLLNGLATGGAIGTFVSYYHFHSSLILAIPIFIAIVPQLIAQMNTDRACKRFGKVRVVLVSGLIGAFFYFLIYFFGNNFTMVAALLVIQAAPGNMSRMAQRFLLPDTIEYTRYMTGKDCSGIMTSLQSFVTKLSTSVASSLGLFLLGLSDWVPVEATDFADLAAQNVAQPQSALDIMWLIYMLIPAIGTVLSVVVFFFYKLRDKDVELMAKCNAGEITREECEAQLSRRYHIG